MPSCVHCGLQFFGNQDSCPNCGHEFTPEEKKRMVAALSMPKKSETTNGLSITGFIISLISTFWSPYGIVGLVGWILSAVGRSQAINEGGKTGLATAGIVLGILGSVGNWLLMLLLPAELSRLVGFIL